MGILKRIEFSQGECVDCQEGDILVLVGPNNVGKSQTLKDIQGMLGELGYSPKTLKRLCIERPEIDEMKQKARQFCREDTSQGSRFLVGYETRILVGSDWPPLGDDKFGSYLPLYLSYVKTEDRLLQVKPPQTPDRLAPETHPIHFLIRNDEYREQLAGYFRKAFGIGLVPDRFDGSHVPLRIGDAPMLDDEDCGDSIARTNVLANKIGQLDRADFQGDGMRSFLGTAMNLVLDYRELFLLDEPECFLHPPQARIIGEVIGSMLGQKKTAIVATHSIDVLRGLLNSASDRIKVIRLTRHDNLTAVKQLDNCGAQEIWSDSMLRYSDALDAIFYENAIVCESDVDCRFYGMLHDVQMGDAGIYSQTKFLACGGKDRLAKVANSLRALGVEYRIVPDLDILNDRAKIKALVESCGGTWQEMDADYKVVSSFFDSKSREMPKRNDLIALLKTSDDERLSRSEQKRIGKLLDGRGPWADLKEYGVSSMRGDQQTRLKELLNKLNQIGVYPVPVGELECFVKDAGGHGSQWLSNVLEKHPNLDDEVYRDAKEFVASWGV